MKLLVLVATLLVSSAGVAQGVHPCSRAEECCPGRGLGEIVACERKTLCAAPSPQSESICVCGGKSGSSEVPAACAGPLCDERGCGLLDD